MKVFKMWNVTVHVVPYNPVAISTFGTTQFFNMHLGLPELSSPQPKVSRNVILFLSFTFLGNTDKKIIKVSNIFKECECFLLEMRLTTRLKYFSDSWEIADTKRPTTHELC